MSEQAPDYYDTYSIDELIEVARRRDVDLAALRQQLIETRGALDAYRRPPMQTNEEGQEEKR